MEPKAYLDDVLNQFRKLKDLADRAVAQVPDEALFAVLDPESNSIALIMKHLSGNMRSRWTDFLTTDGEKLDRNRDAEFEVKQGDTKEAITARWEGGWRCLFEAVSSLSEDDLARTVRVRGEPHSVLEAINTQLAHYASHVGQIVLLAKHHAGKKWTSLSIPRRKPRE